MKDFLFQLFFVLPVFMDSVKYKPLKKERKYIRMVEIAVTGISLFI